MVGCCMCSVAGESIGVSGLVAKLGLVQDTKRSTNTGKAELTPSED